MTVSELYKLEQENKRLRVKANHWDEYHEEKYDMRPTYKILAQMIQNIREEYKYGLPLSLTGCAKLAINIEKILGDKK